mmetsp:Transcript_13760/g.39143  ORF Transcript_13760/g.39143 Transcript_13760/m.39143 type:complete len:258 (+) Transcript_13760:288-1061(+)
MRLAPSSTNNASTNDERVGRSTIYASAHTKWVQPFPPAPRHAKHHSFLQFGQEIMLQPPALSTMTPHVGHALCVSTLLSRARTSRVDRAFAHWRARASRGASSHRWAWVHGTWQRAQYAASHSWHCTYGGASPPAVANVATGGTGGAVTTPGQRSVLHRMPRHPPSCHRFICSASTHCLSVVTATTSRSSIPASHTGHRLRCDWTLRCAQLRQTVWRQRDSVTWRPPECPSSQQHTGHSQRCSATAGSTSSRMSSRS